MANTLKTISVVGAFLSLLLLSACGSATPTIPPTQDLNAVRTEAAATVFAQVSETLTSKPTVTPIPSATPTITPTTMPTLAPSVSPSPNATSSAITPGTTPTSTNDLAEWVSQSIEDGTVFAPGEAFTITWRLKNVGTSTWSASYLLRFYSGNAFGAPTEALLGRIVQPNETVDISIPMRAPTLPGDYRTDWVMSNESRSNFKQPVFLKITVAAPPTSTPTVIATSTTTP